MTFDLFAQPMSSWSVSVELLQAVQTLKITNRFRHHSSNGVNRTEQHSVALRGQASLGILHSLPRFFSQ